MKSSDYNQFNKTIKGRLCDLVENTKSLALSFVIETYALLHASTYLYKMKIIKSPSLQLTKTPLIQY